MKDIFKKPHTRGKKWVIWTSIFSISSQYRYFSPTLDEFWGFLSYLRFHSMGETKIVKPGSMLKF
jgi:hypothetical protein